MAGGKLCLYYSIGLLLWQLFLLVGLNLCNLSPMKSSDIMKFLTLFIPMVMFGSYFFLRMLSRMCDQRKKKDEISEAMLLVFSLTAFLFGAALFYGITVLLGAPLIDDIESTFAFSLLCSSLTVFPLCTVTEARWNDFLNYLPEYMNLKGSLEDSVKMIACFTVLGAWCGAFPIPLDWDRDWQVWPITCCIGCISGHLIGLLYVFVVNAGIIPYKNQHEDDWKHKIT